MKIILCLGIIVTIVGCKKSGPSTSTPPDEHSTILRLNSISAITGTSGAQLYYTFSYKDSLVTEIVQHNLNVGDSITFLFNYNGTEIATIDFYRNKADKNKLPYMRLSASYSNKQISGVHFFYNLDDSLIESSSMQYKYDANGRITEKRGYNILSGVSELNVIHTYSYDADNNIVKVTSESPSGYAIEFDNSFDPSKNVFFENNPALLIFYWYLFDLNQLGDGFAEVQMYSDHKLVSTNRIYSSVQKEIEFNITLTKDGLWNEVFNYPNVYNDSNDLLFGYMSFTYILQDR